jgi:hypothetical protein
LHDHKQVDSGRVVQRRDKAIEGGNSRPRCLFLEPGSQGSPAFRLHGNGRRQEGHGLAVDAGCVELGHRYITGAAFGLNAPASLCIG